MAAAKTSRRTFIQTATAGLLTTSLIRWDTASAAEAQREIRFGVCTDVHKDVIHDADGRLQAFITDMESRELDFIIDLGDFCWPAEKNKGFRDIFHSYTGPKYHALGNHDSDGGFSWRETMDFYGMSDPYYGFDVGGYHFIVLDGNNKPAGHTSGYPHYIGEEQLAWLEKELAETEQPTFVFSHQRLFNAGNGHVDNYAAVQRVLEGGKAKVVACFCGHRHTDVHRELNGIHYLNINSMSYNWVGSKYQHARFSKEIEEAHPYLCYTIPYDTPLYAVVTVRPGKELLVEGRAGAFIPPGPDALGVPASEPGDAPFTASISDRAIPIGH